MNEYVPKKACICELYKMYNFLTCTVLNLIFYQFIDYKIHEDKYKFALEKRVNACKKQNLKLFLVKINFTSAKPTHHAPQKSLFVCLAS